MAPSHPIFGTSAVPRYLRAADLLRQRIAQGEWPPGARLPSLEALSAEFGINRLTARQAVVLLQNEGLVSAQQGRGTFVTETPHTGRTLRLETSLGALAELYQDDKPTLTLIDEEVTHLPPTVRAEGRQASSYHQLRRIHSRGEQPYVLISVFLEERIFRMAPKRFRTRTVLPVLLALPKVRIARAHQTLTIASANIETARHLGIAVSAPIAQVRRTLRSGDDTIIYHGIAAYHSDYIHLEMELIP
jgi:GntR family transcriptional regulator